MEKTTITYGYDRHQRSWCIIVQDEHGDDLETEYCGDKEWCKHSIEAFKQKYNTNTVKKYKAY